VVGVRIILYNYKSHDEHKLSAAVVNRPFLRVHNIIILILCAARARLYYTSYIEAVVDLVVDTE